MGGNKSTGMRVMLVTPMTSNVRQMTTMKYGLRIEKPGIRIYSTLLSRTPCVRCTLLLVGICLVVCGDRYKLRVNFFTWFQTGTVADHYLLALIQA